MKQVAASGEVLKIYQTGDRPILVLCSDGYHYICKYKLPGSAANKLVCELIGSIFARQWGIATPVISLVSNDPIIWDDAGISHDPVAPLLGSRKMENVFDLSSINYNQIEVNTTSLYQLLQIALFDLWIANEDRTCNNFNLLYDLKQKQIVSIDYGGIFNSGISRTPVYQLNATDSIINSDLFDRLKVANLTQVISRLETEFSKAVSICKVFSSTIISNIPMGWDVDFRVVEGKMNELFAVEWQEETWMSFVSIINEC